LREANPAGATRRTSRGSSFCELVAGEERELTGYGISSQICDNEHPIIVLDCKQQRIGFATEPEDGARPEPERWQTFREYGRQAAAEWPAEPVTCIDEGPTG